MDNERKAATAGVFDRAARTYDTVGPAFFSYFGERLAKTAGIFAGARVLDIAAGRGASLFPAARAAGPGGRVTGIDIAPSMVKETAGEISRRAVKNADMRLMDAENLEFGDNSFDIALCGFCVFFFPDAGRAIREVYRVLKPGGKVVLSTWGKTDTRDMVHELVAKYMAQAGGSQKAPLSASKNYEEPAELVEFLSKEGFKSVKTLFDKKDFFYGSKDEWWQAQYSHGHRGTLEKIEKTFGKDGLERFRRDAFGLLEQFKQAEGYRQSMNVLFSTAVKP